MVLLKNELMNWGNIYSETSFMARDADGAEITFTKKGGVPLLIKDKQFAVITAWNPDNNQLTVEENKARNGLLENDLKKTKYVFYPSLGTGTDGHSEGSFTIEEISLTEAVEFGHKYGQHAIAYNDARGFVFERCLN